MVDTDHSSLSTIMGATTDEREPLLRVGHGSRMDESKVGVSQQTLVSSAGRASRAPQYIGAIIANLGSLVSGTCLGWTSTSESPLEAGGYGFTISTNDFSWISSIMALGAIVSGPLTGWLVDLVGRKNTQLILVIPAVLGWALMAWSQSVAMFIVGRFITGIAGGGFSIVVPLYTNEFSEVEIRGTIGCMFQLFLNGGILYTYIIGYFTSVFWLSVACLIVPIVYGVLVLFIMPESPIYYLKTKRAERAKQSLQWFRGKTYDIEPEISTMQKNLDIIEEEKVPFLKAFSTTAAKKALVIGIGVMLLQQISGINSVIFYSTSIFTDAGANLDANIETIIVGVVIVVFTYISTLIIERMGRRPLLLISAIGMAICSFILGLYFYLQNKTTVDVTNISWLPILAVCCFLVLFSIGFGPIPWMFIGEVIPRQIVGYASSICCMFNWFGAFIVTKFFSDLTSLVGSYGAFWIFAIISVLSAIFVFFLVPETKGKTLEEIQIILTGKQKPKITPTPQG